MLRTALLAGVAGVAQEQVQAQAQEQVACDLSKAREKGGADAICADFCNYKCGFWNASSDLPVETGKPQNITLYRITPFNASGIINKNTGDAAGDVGFFLSRKNITQQCAKDPNSFGCFLDGDNMYGQFTVEVDGSWGPYEECNPVSVGGDGRGGGGMPDGSGWTDTQNFQCGQNCLAPTRKANCTAVSHNSWDQPRNGSSREGGFSCFCPEGGRNLKAVGREPRGGHQFQNRPIVLPSGKSWDPPPQCSQGGFEPPCLVEGRKSKYGQSCLKRGGCLAGTEHKTVTGHDFASTASLACAACSGDKACTGWAITNPDNKTATLFSGAVQTKKLIECVSATKSHNRYGGGGANWYGVDAGPGHWFNTPVEGMCADGQSLGGLTVEGSDHCSWRVAETVKYANASCIDTKVDDTVEKLGAACFATCNANDPEWKISDCYLDCYLNTLIGFPGYNITKTSGSAIVEPWVKGFTSDDPAEGGCPRVKPLPCKGAQCPAPEA